MTGRAIRISVGVALLGACAFAGALPAGATEAGYDRALEKAAAGIVAARIGDLRGGLAFAEQPSFVRSAPPTPRTTQAPRRPAEEAVADGLVPAVERPRSHGIY